MPTKTCSQCKVEKPISEYYVHEKKNYRNTHDRLMSTCKSCTSEIRRKYRQNNLQKFRQYDTKRREVRRKKGLCSANGCEVTTRESYCNKHSDHWANRKYLAAYGITLEEKRKMWYEQDGRCAIPSCSKELLTSRDCHLDHDHETGKVRKILCPSCNHYMVAADNQKLLEDLIAYRNSFL